MIVLKIIVYALGYAMRRIELSMKLRIMDIIVRYVKFLLIMEIQ
jgi:hypothetical protein